MSEDSDSIYDGDERRKHVHVYRCEFHAEHVHVLSALTKQLQRLSSEIDHRRDTLDSKMSQCTTTIWAELRTKLSAKIALTFLIAFTLAYAGGVLTVYKGVQANRLTIVTSIAEIRAELNQSSANIRLELNNIAHDVRDVKQQLEKPNK